MKLFERFGEFYDRIEDEGLERKLLFYTTSFVWLIYLMSFIHELGHAVVAIALGCNVTEFVIRLEGGGSIKYYPPLNTMPYDYTVLNTLVSVSGGIAVMLFFMVLSHKTKWFYIPAALVLLDGFLEALYMGELRIPLGTLTILTSMWAIGMLIRSLPKPTLEPKEQGLKISPPKRNWRMNK